MEHGDPEGRHLELPNEALPPGVKEGMPATITGLIVGHNDDGTVNVMLEGYGVVVIPGDTLGQLVEPKSGSG